jgi:hypothetical protein
VGSAPERNFVLGFYFVAMKMSAMSRIASSAFNFRMWVTGKNSLKLSEDCESIQKRNEREQIKPMNTIINVNLLLVSFQMLVSPVLAGLAVAIGVPILLFYVYGVVPGSTPEAMNRRRWI